MNKLIKQEWIKRILESSLTPEFLLNQLYEECTGDLIRYDNRWGSRDENGKISKTIHYSLIDPIDERAAKWSGLETSEPLLPSYPEMFGHKDKVYKDGNLTLYAVYKHGQFKHEYYTGDGAKRKLVSELRPLSRKQFCELIDKDL